MALKCIFKEPPGVCPLLSSLYMCLLTSLFLVQNCDSMSFIFLLHLLLLLWNYAFYLGEGGGERYLRYFSVEAVSCIIFRREYFSTLTYKCFIVIDSVASQDRKFLLLNYFARCYHLQLVFTIMFKIFIMMLMQMICG